MTQRSAKLAKREANTSREAGNQTARQPRVEATQQSATGPATRMNPRIWIWRVMNCCCSGGRRDRDTKDARDDHEDGVTDYTTLESENGPSLGAREHVAQHIAQTNRDAAWDYEGKYYDYEEWSALEDREDGDDTPLAMATLTFIPKEDSWTRPQPRPIQPVRLPRRWLCGAGCECAGCTNSDSESGGSEPPDLEDVLESQAHAEDTHAALDGTRREAPMP